MKKLFLILILSNFGFVSNAQQEASNWFFGDNAGITFNQNGTTTATNGQLNTDEGCTSISDADGNLLFYTDGITVYNSVGNIMPGGNGLKGNPSSTQSAIIVPKPLDPDIYYIFTVDTFFIQNDPNAGLHDYEVNMTLNGGLGEVVSETQLLQNSTEKISAVLKDCDSQNIWVITMANPQGTPPPNNTPTYNTFHAFEVTATGVNTSAVTSPAGVTLSERRGYLKFSPDGTKLASANVEQGLFLYDFDVTTGQVVGNPTILNITTVNNGARFSYGLEFSQNSNLLYVSSYNNFFVQNSPLNENPSSHFSSLVQFDLTAANIQASQILIDQRQQYRSALQTGPDGKIYRTTSATYNQGRPFLSVINNPNEIGTACNYQRDAVPLTRNSRQGLPPFITSFFADKIDIINDPDISTTFLPLCEGELYTLTADDIAGATYTWTFNGTIQPTPTVPYEFEVSQNGLYNVLIELNNGDCETFEGEALVEYSSFPQANTPSRIEVCDNSLNDQRYIFDLTQQNAIILDGQDSNDYTVHYYSSNDDAVNDENEIIGLYENITNPQEIFVRVNNANNSNCFETIDQNTGLPVSFFIQVYNTPIINRLEDINSCDLEGDTSDGIITTDLQSLNSDILGPLQNTADYTISYHGSNDDALNNISPLTNLYQNQPFNDEVFVRMVNNANTECVTIGSFLITVALTPATNTISLLQCDEDGIPDGRTFFNITEKNDDFINGNPDLSIAYYANMTDAMAETNEINADNYNNVSNPEIIIARVTNTTTQCFSFSQVTLEVSTTSANNAYLGVCDTDGTEDGFTNFDLSMADADVLNGLPPDLTLVYYVTLDDALLEQNPLDNDFTNTVAFNQTIFVRVENDNDCYGINEVTLEVFELPNVETEFGTIYCRNTFPENIVLTGGVIDDIPNNYYYNWSTGETTINIEVNEPGTYTVEVSNVVGCSKTRTITVMASDTATFENIEITDASSNNTVTVLVSGDGNYEYTLDNGNGSYQDSNSFENVQPGIYTVFVRDKNGCGISEELISVVGFPKFFTPNGDSQNDFWQIKGISSQFQPDTIIYIYDRYGKLLSQINPLGNGWDGNFNGNPMPTNDYWFSVKLQDGRRFSSHFTLKR